MQKKTKAKETVWMYLEARPSASTEQLFIKGRRLTAANVVSSMLAEKFTEEEAANDWSLPVEAVQEAVAYWTQNFELIQREALLVREQLRHDGFAIP